MMMIIYSIFVDEISVENLFIDLFTHKTLKFTI